MQFIIASSAIAASSADIDRLTSYAVMLGRASACGIDTKMLLVRLAHGWTKFFHLDRAIKSHICQFF